MINVGQRKAAGASPTPTPEARHRSASASEMATHKFQMAQQIQQSYQCQATSRKRARNSAGAAKRQATADGNQRATGAGQLAPLKDGQPQQAADNSVWVISLMNNIEQLLATFNSINNQSKLQQQQQQQPHSCSASSSGYSTPSNSLSPPFLLSSTNCSPSSSSEGQSPTHSSCSPYTTAGGSPPASCISSCNPGKGGAPVVAATNSVLVPSGTIKQQHLPRSSLSRQIKFHEYKGPPQAKRPPPSSSSGGNKPPVAAGGSSSQQTSPSGPKRAENEQQAADPMAASKTGQLPNRGQQLRPVASVDQIKIHQQQLARQQQQQAQNSTRGCVQFAVSQQQQQQMSRLASKLINSNRTPAERRQESPCNPHQATFTSNNGGDCRAAANIIDSNNPTIQQQSTVRQPAECCGDPTAPDSQARDQKRGFKRQLGGNNQFIPDNCGPTTNNSDSEQPVAPWNGNLNQQQQQRQSGANVGGHCQLVGVVCGHSTAFELGDGRLDVADTNQFGALDDADLGAVDTCDIEPTICFNGQNFDESLMFSEFIDLQDVPMNVNESDWLRKFLPPCI